MMSTPPPPPPPGSTTTTTDPPGSPTPPPPPGSDTTTNLLPLLPPPPPNVLHPTPPPPNLLLPTSLPQNLADGARVQSAGTDEHAIYQDRTRKVVLMLGVHDDKTKQKVMKIVSGLSGVVTIALDMKDKEMTIIGDVDPVVILIKLRKKICHADIIAIGPAIGPAYHRLNTSRYLQMDSDSDSETPSQCARFSGFVDAFACLSASFEAL